MIYVVMEDTFMSGWGRADGKVNKLVFECDTTNEANTVYLNAKSRKEMKKIKIVNNFPHHLNKPGVLLQIKNKEVYPNWYEARA